MLLYFSLLYMVVCMVFQRFVVLLFRYFCSLISLCQDKWLLFHTLIGLYNTFVY